VDGSKSSGRGESTIDVNSVVLDHRYTPTSPTCDVARNIDVGENARLVTGDVTKKQSTNLQTVGMYRIVNFTIRPEPDSTKVASQAQ